MRTLSILVSFFAISLGAVAAPADSLIIRIGKSSRIAIYAPTKDQLKNITKYDLNQIVKDMVSKLDSVPEGQVYIIHEENGKEYRRDSVAVVRKSRGNVTITIDSSSDRTEPTDSTSDNEYSYERTAKNRGNGSSGSRHNYSSGNNWRVSTDFHLGLNTWVNGPANAVYNGNSYELNTIGSRYFAISLTQNPALIRSKYVKVSIRYGLQVAWNNFMFQEDVRLERETDNIVFKPFGAPLQKSKLTVCNLELPFVPQFSFYNNNRRRVFNVGFGGFIGYRLDSYTKIKLENDDVNRDHNSFFLNNLQYGVQGNIGVGGLNFFVKYHLTDSFQSGRGPAVRPLSFGITI